MLEVETLSTGGSVSRSSGLVSEENMGGLMVWVMAREMGRSLSRILSCKGKNSMITQRDSITWESYDIGVGRK